MVIPKKVDRKATDHQFSGIWLFSLFGSCFFFSQLHHSITSAMAPFHDARPLDLNDPPHGFVLTKTWRLKQPLFATKTVGNHTTFGRYCFFSLLASVFSDALNHCSLSDHLASGCHLGILSLLMGLWPMFRTCHRMVWISLESDISRKSKLASWKLPVYRWYPKPYNPQHTHINPVKHQTFHNN